LTYLVLPAARAFAHLYVKGVIFGPAHLLFGSAKGLADGVGPPTEPVADLRRVPSDPVQDVNLGFERRQCGELDAHLASESERRFHSVWLTFGQECWPIVLMVPWQGMETALQATARVVLAGQGIDDV